MNRHTWKSKKFDRRQDVPLLDRNENCDSGMSKFISDFIATLTPEKLLRYPDMRKAYLSIEKMGYNPDQVLLTYGAEHAIRSIMCFHRRLHSISYTVPTYAMVPMFAEMGLFKAIEIKLGEDFNYDISALTTADIIYVATPSNTTGCIIDNGSISQLCKNGKIVIVDETYGDFNKESAVSLLGHHENIYIVKSFSKSFGVAGLRLGMVISTEGNIHEMINEKPAYEANSVSCEFLEYAANNIEEMHNSVERIKAGKLLIEEELAKNGYKYRNTYANFVLAEYDANLFANLNTVASINTINIADKDFIRITAPDISTVQKMITDGAFKHA